MALTYDGSMAARGLALFVDGEKQPVRITYNTASNTPGAPNAPLRIGALPDKGYSSGKSAPGCRSR